MNPDRSKAPDINAITDLSLTPVRTLILDNGMTLHVIDRGHDEVNRLTALRDGGLAEADNKAIAELTARLLTEGTRSHTAEEIADTIEFNGSWISSQAHSHHHTLNMSSINSRFRHVAPVMAEIWEEPSFPEDAFNINRAMMVKRIEEMGLKVAFVADSEAAKLAMGNSNPLASILTPEIADSTRIEQIREFYKKCAETSPTDLYIAGRITPEIEDCVNDTFGQLPYPGGRFDSGQGLKITPFEKMPGKGLERETFGPTVRIPVADALQSGVNIVLPAVPRKHPDYIPLRLTVITLGGYFGSRLMRNIREDKGYTYGIVANLLGYLDGSYIQIACECDNGYVEPLIEEVIAELKAMTTRKVEHEELMRVRQSVTSSLLSIVDTPFTTLDYYLNIQLVGTPPEYFRNLLDASVSFTPDTIAEMAEKYLDPALMQTVIAGK